MMRFRRHQLIVIEPEALSSGISLEALGLLAHIIDEQATEALQLRFPDYDIDALVAELISAGLVSESEGGRSPEDFEPRVEPRVTVYVIEAGGIYKIGVTSNLKARYKHYRTHAAHPPVIVWHRKFEDATAIERRLHEQLAAFRTHGEWFACDGEIIARVLSEYGASEG